jgi:hypothetical protein
MHHKGIMRDVGATLKYLIRFRGHNNICHLLFRTIATKVQISFSFSFSFVMGTIDWLITKKKLKNQALHGPIIDIFVVSPPFELVT